MAQESASLEAKLATSVILAPHEHADDIGKVLDTWVFALHAQMQRGEISPKELSQYMSQGQPLRDGIIATASVGEILHGGHRLCYFTLEQVRIVYLAISFVRKNKLLPELPDNYLHGIEQKFQTAYLANRRGEPPSQPREIPSNNDDSAAGKFIGAALILVFPAACGLAWGYFFFNYSEWQPLAGCLVAAYVSFVIGSVRYKSDDTVDAQNMSFALSIVSSVIWPITLPIYVVMFVVNDLFGVGQKR